MSKDEYLITDAPLKALTVFAMPMILGSFFQQVYNMADSIIVGQFVGSSALAAVGACAALTNVFICIALGAGVGAGVLVSRYFGARDYSKMKTIVSTSLISFLILSVITSSTTFVNRYFHIFFNFFKFVSQSKKQNGRTSLPACLSFAFAFSFTQKCFLYFVCGSGLLSIRAWRNGRKLK